MVAVEQTSEVDTCTQVPRAVLNTVVCIEQ